MFQPVCFVPRSSLPIDFNIGPKPIPAGTDPNDPLFDGVGNLPEQFIPASMALGKFCGKHLMLQSGAQYFDWSSFLAACEGYRSEDLRVLKTDGTTISQSNQTVSTITQRIAAWLHSSYRLRIDLIHLAAIIQNTFTNLKDGGSGSDFLQFGGHHEQNNSSWEYRLTYGVMVPGRPVFDALVATIKIWADIREESSWWGLESHTSRSFGVTITAAELEVSKDFHVRREASEVLLDRVRIGVMRI